MVLAQIIVYSLAAYFAVGILVAILFLALGVARIDEAAKGAGLKFRATIFLGCVALWPIVLIRWLSGRKINQPIEDQE